MRALVLPALLLSLATTPAAAQPFEDFFRYEEPRLPVASECGGAAAWRGEFAGRRYDNFRDRYEPVSARGCFDSESECRIWNQQAITYLGRGPMYYATCRPGGY